MTARVKQETCARCGHTTPDCDRCGQSWPFLGAGIGPNRYCHTYVERPAASCYEIAVWQWSAMTGGGAPWVHWPREVAS